MQKDWRVIIRRLFAKNAHGAGMMFYRGMEIEIRKGYKTGTALVKGIEKLGDITEIDFCVHCRIATSGGSKMDMCHPFPITRKKKAMKFHNVKCQAALMHNGVISEFEQKDEEYSDSANLAYALADYGTEALENNDALFRLMVAAISGSRVIMFTKNKITTIGHWIKGADGCMYSNTDYVAPPTTRVYNSNGPVSLPSTDLNPAYVDDMYEDYGHPHFGPQDNHVSKAITKFSHLMDDTYRTCSHCEGEYLSSYLTRIELVSGDGGYEWVCPTCIKWLETMWKEEGIIEGMPR